MIFYKVAKQSGSWTVFYGDFLFVWSSGDDFKHNVV